MSGWDRPGDMFSAMALTMSPRGNLATGAFYFTPPRLSEAPFSAQIYQDLTQNQDVLGVHLT